MYNNIFALSSAETFAEPAKKFCKIRRNAQLFNVLILRNPWLKTASKVNFLKAGRLMHYITPYSEIKNSICMSN